MKYPMSHYDPPAIQHTRATAALTISQMCMELYKSAPNERDGEWQVQLKKRISACTTMIKKKRQSAGAKRDLNNMCIILAEYIEEMRSLKGDRLMRAWVELIWAALTFIEDVLATCPVITADKERGKWELLHKDMEELADGLLESVPGADERGTGIYEECAWALEGILFHAPQMAA